MAGDQGQRPTIVWTYHSVELVVCGAFAFLLEVLATPTFVSSVRVTV